MEKLKTVWAFLSGMNRRMVAANLSLVAAGSAFFMMLSLFPGLAAFVAILGFVIDPSIVDDQLALLKDFVPAEAFEIIDAQLRLLASTNNSTLGWASAISTGAAFWSARRGTDALIKAVNAVYDAPERNGLRGTITALAITAALIMVGIVAILALVVLPVVMAFLPLGSFTAFAIEVSRWVIALVVVISGIWVLYRFSPNIKAMQVPWITPGSVMAMVVWAAATWGFTYYLTNFGSYNEVYGSIGAVVALLMFLYISIFVVLLGATLNAEIGANKGSIESVAEEAVASVAAAQQDAQAPAAEANLSEVETYRKET